MAWVLVQKATEATWADYERVQGLVGDDRPDGLIVHAAGEDGGTWRAVSVWESEDAYRRFRDDKLVPAVGQAFGHDSPMQEPPPQESFEVKHLIT